MLKAEIETELRWKTLCKISAFVIQVTFQCDNLKSRLPSLVELSFKDLHDRQDSEYWQGNSNQNF